MNKFTIVQSVIILKRMMNDYRVLMCLRSENEDVYPNLWGIPGGKLDETDATLIDGLNREVMEEVSITIKDHKMIQSNIKGDKVYITYMASWEKGLPKVDGDELTTCDWLGKREINILIKQKKITPFTGELLLDYVFGT